MPRPTRKRAHSRAKPKGTGINLRRAAAGRQLLLNPETSMRQALKKAGYSESVARKPTENGVGADRCIAEAIKADPTIDPARLVQKARRALEKKLDSAISGTETYRLGESAKVLDVLERWYGATGRPDDTSARGFVDRLEFMQAVLGELERRKRQAEAVEAVDVTPIDDTAADATDR